MIKDFKFFQKEEKGTLDIIDGVTYSSASFNADTPDGHVYRRHLYHTQREAYDRLRGVYDNERSEIPRGRFGTPERHQDILRRLQMTNDSRDLNDNPIRLFQATRTVTVNPTLWTKVKIFGTRVKLVLIETWKLEPIGVVVMTLLVSVVTFIGVMKLFGA